MPKNPSLYVYHDKMLTWQPLLQDIQLRLALLDSLASGKPLKLMYSLNFGDEIDEAFYYNKGKPTIEELEKRNPAPSSPPTRTVSADTELSSARPLPEDKQLAPITKRPTLTMSDSRDSEEELFASELIQSVSIPPQGLSPGERGQSHTADSRTKQDYERFSIGTNALDYIATDTGNRSQTVTTTT